MWKRCTDTIIFNSERNLTIPRTYITNERYELLRYDGCNLTIPNTQLCVKWDSKTNTTTLVEGKVNEVAHNGSQYTLFTFNNEGNISGGILYDVYLQQQFSVDQQNPLEVVRIESGDFYKNLITEEVSADETFASSYILKDGSIKNAVTNRRVSKYTIDPTKKYYIRGHVSDISQIMFAVYDESDTPIYLGPVGTGSGSVKSYGIFDLPSNAATIAVASNSTVQNPQLFEVLGHSDAGNEEVEVSPHLSIRATNKNTGDISDTNRSLGAWSTSRFIALKSADYIKVTTGAARMLNVLYYDSDYQYLGNSETSANTQETITTPANIASSVKYIKIMFATTGYTGNAKTTLKVKGILEDNWDVYNIRPSDSGYKKIMVQVNVAHPNTGDETTDSYQDSAEYLVDYGVVCLPEKYSNTGEPTRLIIYCHGAAVNYSSSVSRFNAQDLEPEYWLSEGYAIMDIEGNPFDNTNEHMFIPQSLQCYIAAYNWVIETYNIKRDGVFLGGRSMGGGMTFNILRRECHIPVIAACPNVPSTLPQGTWNYMSAARRTFCANHFGFVNQPTWTSEIPMTADEWNCLKENFYRWSIYHPILSMITDLPSKDILMQDGLNCKRGSNMELKE